MGMWMGYLGYMFTHDNRRPHRGGWIVKGTVYWTLNPDRVNDQGWMQILDRWNAEGYKIGLLIRADQAIRELVYGGVRLAPVRSQGAAARDLNRTYGTPAGFKWVAWGGRGRRLHSFIQPHVVRFPVRMKIAPAGPGPQLVPVASRHLEGSFARSMPGVWAIHRPKVRMRAKRRAS